MNEEANPDKIIFEKAQTLSASERDAFLDEVCRGNPELKDEILSLLEASERLNGILDSDTNFDLPSRGHRSRDHIQLSPGTILGNRYRIVALVGYGGMGEVYHAYDQKLRESVALKFVDCEFRLESLLNEVKRARKVSHPNVGRVHDLIELKGHHFLSMEFIEGEDLRRCQQRLGKFDQENAFHLFRQLCLGLQAIHDEGLVHRDLKPGNLMVDGSGTLRITDFGLAHDSGQMDNIEAAIGTPAYMSPEQVLDETISARSDLYSAGLILYEMLTGERLLPVLWEEVKTFHQSNSVIEQIKPDLIEPATYKLISWCLDKDPSNRPSSAESLMDALPFENDPLSQAKLQGNVTAPLLVNAIPKGNGIHVRTAVGLVILVLLALAARQFFFQGQHIFSMRPLTASTDSLREIARQTLTDLGIEKEDFFFEEDIVIDTPSIDLVSEKHTDHLSAWLTHGIPSAVFYRIQISDHPIRSRDGPISDATMIELSPEGNLRRFEFKSHDEHEIEHPAYQNKLIEQVFHLAGLDKTRFHELDKGTTTTGLNDHRREWIPIDPTSFPIKVFFSSDGNAISFSIRVNPSEPSPPPDAYSTMREASYFIVIFCLGLAAWNCWRGRADLVGAIRFAIILGILGMIHGASVEFLIAKNAGAFLMEPVITECALNVFCSCAIYLATEPIVRRCWPELLISWTKLLYGKYSDPLVGRDLLIGMSFGALTILLGTAFEYWDQDFLDKVIPKGVLMQGNIYGLGSFPGFLSSMTEVVLSSILWASMWILLFSVTKAITRRQWTTYLMFVGTYPWMLYSAYGVEWNTPSTVFTFVCPFAIYFIITATGLLGFFGFCFTISTVLLIPPLSSELNWMVLGGLFHIILITALLLASVWITTRYHRRAKALIEKN